MIEAEFYIDRLLEYFQVSTISELAQEIGISQPSISAWKKNNYVSAIKKKCRELGIYTEIFGGINREIFNIHGSDIVGKVDGRNGTGIKKIYNGEKLHFQEEYKKIEQLAEIGKGYENLKGFLEELKEKLKKEI